jgi:hypothetical protein
MVAASFAVALSWHSSWHSSWHRCGIRRSIVVAFVVASLWHSSWHLCGIRCGIVVAFVVASSGHSSRHHSIISLHPRHAPPGTQACAFDIKAFHRTCPVLPDHKPFLVVQSNGLFLLKHCYPFGARPASSDAGQICRAVVNIWNAETANDADIKGYEDDLSSLRFPNTDGPFRPIARRMVLHPPLCLSIIA